MAAIDKRVSPRVTTETIYFLEQSFKTINSGAEIVLNSFPALYSTTIHGLAGMFTVDELKMIVMVMVSVQVNSDILGMLVASRVSKEFSGYQSDKWRVEEYSIMSKFNNLTPFQAACLDIWSTGFDIESDKIDKYIQYLA